MRTPKKIKRLPNIGKLCDQQKPAASAKRKSRQPGNQPKAKARAKRGLLQTPISFYLLFL